MFVNEEIPMYCCLTFSYAVKYGFITIDYERNLVEIPLRNLTDDKKQEISLKQQKYKERISQYIDFDYLYPVHCPWCGLHLNIAIDFEKGCMREGQYSSKESWER
jgi:hypothetical protein